MQEEYKTVYRGGEGEIVEKKSRFIATVRPVHSEEEVLAFIEEVKKKYWDARHNCFAYVIGVTNPTLRCSDDGEPAGTAGKPMLDVLTGEDLHDTADQVFWRDASGNRWSGAGLSGSSKGRSSGKYCDHKAPGLPV
mgnify:CR=1 FL=1